jgi:hypothetical protein
MNTLPAGRALIAGRGNLYYADKRITGMGLTLPAGYIRLVFADGTACAVWRDTPLQARAAEGEE